MTSVDAPTIAVFLMDRIGNCDPILIGDLQEEYRAGRSRVWFWREAIYATASSMGQACYAHPVLLLRAMIGLWALNAAMGMLVHVISDAGVWLHIVPGWLYMKYRLYAMPIMILGPGCVFAAWIVARLHAAVRAPATLALLLLSVPGAVIDPEWHRLWENMPDPRFVPYLAVHVAGYLIWSIGTVVGGLLLPVRGKPISR